MGVGVHMERCVGNGFLCKEEGGGRGGGKGEVVSVLVGVCAIGCQFALDDSVGNEEKNTLC